MSGPKVIFGLVLIFIGLFFLLASMGIIDWDFGDLVAFMWPVILIMIGVWFIFKKKKIEVNISSSQPASPPPPSGGTYQAPPPPPSGQPQGARPYEYKYSYQSNEKASQSASASSAGRIKYSKFAGDMFIDCNNIELHNVEISSFMGSSEIKVHGGRLGPGLNRLVVSGFIGDVRIFIPKDMPVLCTSSSFIGDVELLGRRSSGLGNTIDARTENYDSAESKLFIAVNHFIGDVRVYVV